MLLLAVATQAAMHQHSRVREVDCEGEEGVSQRGVPAGLVADWNALSLVRAGLALPHKRSWHRGGSAEQRGAMSTVAVNFGDFSHEELQRWSKLSPSSSQPAPKSAPANAPASKPPTLKATPLKKSAEAFYAASSVHRPDSSAATATANLPAPPPPPERPSAALAPSPSSRSSSDPPDSTSSPAGADERNAPATAGNASNANGNSAAGDSNANDSGAADALDDDHLHAHDDAAQPVPTCDHDNNVNESGEEDEEEEADDCDVSAVTEDDLKPELCTDAGLYRARGIANPGNLCYANATLQALLATQPLLDLGKRLAAADRRGAVPRRFRVVRALSRLCDSVCQKDAKEPLDSEAVEPFLRLFRPSERRGSRSQEDAQELLSFLLDTLHSELHDLRKQSGMDDVTQGAEEDPFGGEWEEVGKKNKSAVTREVGEEKSMRSAVKDIFYGKLRSNLREPNRKPSATLQLFNTLQLEISDSSVKDVDSALRTFASTETLYDDRGTPKTKWMQVAEPPAVLIVQLNRFTYTDHGEQVKLEKPVKYRSVLTLGKHVCQTKIDNEQPTYDLFATISHHGRTMTSGHYSADVRVKNKWLRIDDTSVTTISPKDAFHGGAYLLCYRRRDMSPTPQALVLQHQHQRRQSGGSRSANGGG